jgi:general secretion pathway protein G
MRRHGFTLIELLVVMAIIAALLTLATPRYFQHVDRTRETVLKSDLATMRDAVDKFFGDTGKYPESLDELVARRYLRRMPVDPITESAETWVVVAPADTKLGNVYDVRSGAPGMTRDGKPFGEL